VYVRQGAAGDQPLLVWAPAPGEKCQVELASLEALRALDPRYEQHGRQVVAAFGAVFKSPELANYEPVGDIALPPPADALPAAVRKLLGWPEAPPRAPGAYPERR
jgi:hypothetical protein